MKRRHRTTAAQLALVAGLLTAGLLTACGSGSSSASSSAAGAGTAGELAAPAAASAAAAGTADKGFVSTVGNGAASGAAGAGQVAVGQHVIRNVQVTLEVKVLETAAAAVRQAALDVGGFVSSETTGYAPTDPTPVDAAGTDTSGAARKPPVAGESVIVLRVPVAKLDDTVKRVTDKLGTVLSRTSSAQDVTGDVADLTSRVATQKASVARVRELLAKAGDLKDVVLIEAELSRREADLEALQARLASLNDRADLSTVTVTLRTPNAANPDSGASIWEPLRPGWNALVGSFTFLLTVAGGLLPFAVVGVLLWWPVRWAWRRWFARPHPATLPMPAGPATGSGPVPPPGR